MARITNHRDTPRSQRFTYDALNRIQTAQTAATYATHPAKCWAETFTYDVWANLLSIAGIQPEYTGCTQENLSVGVNTKNQISSAGFVHDAAGNLTNTPNPGSLTMVYDAENRMISVAGVSYSYDGDGRRVMKSAAGTPPQPFKLYWYGTSADALVETDAAGSNATEYIFFNGRRIARREPSGSVFYYLADHLGSSRVVTNSTGTVVEESDYYPFGGERVVVNNDPNAYKFTGKERDPESGLDYFGFRYHSSSLGRFMVADPLKTGGDVVELLNPQARNAYTYVINNPLNAVDPDGLDYYLIGGDRCGKDIQCDKDGFVTDENGNRVVVTDEDFLNGTNGVKGSFDPETGKVTITTALGTFEGSFFDPNPLSITVSPSFDELKLMALETAGAQADVGVKAGMVVIGIPNALALGGAIAATAGPGATLTLGSRVVTPTPGQLASITQVAAQAGRRGVERALRSYEKRLAQHLADLEKYKQAGGYTSYTEKEIANFRGLIQAARDWLSKNP